MISLSWALLFVVAALLCFGAAAIGFASIKRVSLLGAGLFFLTLYLIASGDLVRVHIGG